MEEESVLLRATGSNGHVELYEDFLKIVRVEGTEAFPLVQICSIQFSKGGWANGGKGFIHFRLLGEREIAGFAEAQSSKYGLVFDGKQANDFENFRKETERRTSVLLFGLAARPETYNVQGKIENALKKNPDVAALLDKKTIQDGLDLIRDVEKSWREAQEKKLKLQEQEYAIADRQHKRGMYLLALMVATVFSLAVITLYKEQYELVKWILSSTFAAGAGAGLKEVLGRKSREK